MKKPTRPTREQLNSQSQTGNQLPTEQEENFSLEDILREFGGWSQPEPSQAEPVEAETPVSQEAEQSPDEVAAEAEAPVQSEPVQEEVPATQEEPEEPTSVAKSLEQPASKFQFVTLDSAAAAGTPVATPVAKPMVLHRPRKTAPPSRKPQDQPKEIKVRKERAPRSIAPEPDYPETDKAYQAVCHKGRSVSLRCRVLVLLTLCAMAVTVLGALQPQSMPWLQGQMASLVLMGILLVSSMVCYDVLVDGVYHSLKLAFGLDSLLAAATVVFAVDGFFSVAEGKAPYTAVLCLAQLFALWGRSLELRAKRRAYKTVLSMDEHPVSATVAPKACGDWDCIIRGEGNRGGYAASVEAPAAVERAMRVYAPMVFCIALVLSGVLQYLKGSNFLSSFSAMLAGAIPAAAFLTFWRPFAAVTARLQQSGAALCGWQGAKELSGKRMIAAQDGDLFPKANVSMNGMKIYGEYNVSQVVGYTYAVIAASGSGLEPAFAEVFANQNGRSFTIDQFKRYEGGGIGAEIQADVVLVGSMGFMQLMGVKMPEGTNLRQAVYCAVNNQLAAVFAIHYNPSSAVKSALQTIQRSKHLRLLLATRDFILTPAAIRHKYKVPANLMEYPDADERAKLSGSDLPDGHQAGALLGRDSFLAMTEAVSAGRGLVYSVRVGLTVNLLAGLVGFIITLLLSYLGAFEVASALNLMLYSLLWSVPGIVLTAITGK